MALESLYLADIDRSHQELSYRLTSRVAWFLGQSLEERAQYFETIRELYLIRSTIAHGERLPNKKEEIASRLLVEAPKLLRATLSRFIQRQGPQDKSKAEKVRFWRDLVLGGGRA